MHSLLSALLLCAAPLAAADDLTKETDRQLLERIFKNKNTTSQAVFEELGSRKTRGSLNALEKGFAEISANPALKSACRAFRHYRGVDGLERSAITTLYAAAQDQKATRQRLAAYGLALFPDAARAELDRLVERSDDEVTRANALVGLLPSLSESGGKREFKKVSQAMRTTTSLTKAKGVKAFKTFLAKGGPKLFTGTLTDKGLRLETRRMIAQVLSQSKEPGVEQHLVDGLKAEEDSLVHDLLLILLARGCEDYGKHLKRLSRSKDQAIRRDALVAQAQLLGGDPTFFDKLLDQAEEDDPILRSAAAISLGTIRTPDALSALHELLGDMDYSVRFQALDATFTARHPSSVGPLLDRLERESGTLRPVLIKRLRLFTGEDFGSSTAMWRNWWRDHEDGYQLPPLEEAIKADEERGKRKGQNSTRASFYGMRIVSDRLCFVIDNSGSMTNKTKSGKTRLAAVQEQLTSTFEGLPNGTMVNMVFFAVRAVKWEDDLRILNNDSRIEATRMIASLGTAGMTVTYEGLVAGLSDPRVDTLYVLTDGQPVGGVLPKTGDILREIGRLNSVRHVVIHCVSVGRDSTFLQKLASENSGEYTRVD